MYGDSDNNDFFANTFSELNKKYITISNEIYQINKARSELLDKINRLNQERYELLKQIKNLQSEYKSKFVTSYARPNPDPKYSNLDSDSDSN